MKTDHNDDPYTLSDTGDSDTDPVYSDVSNVNLQSAELYEQFLEENWLDDPVRDVVQAQLETLKGW